MKFRVERDALADAVAWTAKSLPSSAVRPGARRRAAAGRRRPADRSPASTTRSPSQVTVGVQADSDGAALVSGRLLAEITKALPAKPVEVAAVGTHLELVCGSARFTLPTMPVEDYPTLPTMPEIAGVIDASTFAQAVAQVAVAAGRDDTLPMLTGVRMEIEGDDALAARHRPVPARGARADLAPEATTASASQALVPARTLADTAKTLGRSVARSPSRCPAAASAKA